MQQEELEEKITMLEELIQGFIGRITIIETEMPGFLNTFLQQYKETLDRIASRIEQSNKRYDDQKIQQQIDEVKNLVATVPKVIGVKNSHHFGKWSKNLIIGIVVAFIATAGSVGTALYLNHQNDRLNSEAYNFWLVRAIYPTTADSVLSKLKRDPDGFSTKAVKAMERQQAIAAAKAIAEQAEKDQQAAKENLDKVKSGR